MKKFINTPATSVSDALHGLVAVNPGLQLLTGHQVVLRADLKNVTAAGKVTLLSGGGAGHEPAHGGYVGSGMLTGAIAGAVFTSPSTSSILAAIEAVQSSAGTLIIIKNYTGDRLNFGLAMERAKAKGIKIDSVVVGEDCALTDINQTAGRRGLGGTVFVHKIAGAMAEDGRSLEEIINVIKQLTVKMGTIGLSLSGCSLPGQPQTFHLQDTDMELGLGIHGEAGVKRIKLQSARECVDTMLTHMTNVDSSSHVTINTDDHITLMVNNLGATSVLELNIIAHEAIQWLESRSVHVDRVYCGSFMTALNMAGISITLLHTDHTIANYLDAPTSTPAWTRPLHPIGVTNRKTPPTIDAASSSCSGHAEQEGVKLSTENAQLIIASVQSICDTLTSSTTLLNELDREGGDGDCGNTHTTCALAIRRQLDLHNLHTSQPYNLLLDLAAVVETHMGGSSGALYSIFFSAAALPLRFDTTPQSWCKAFNTGLQAIMKYGGAKPGFRTMVDPMNAFSTTLEEQLEHTEWRTAVQRATDAAEASMVATQTMRAQAGRASYVSPDRLQNPDPGAKAVALWLRAICDTCTSELS